VLLVEVIPSKSLSAIKGDIPVSDSVIPFFPLVVGLGISSSNLRSFSEFLRSVSAGFTGFAGTAVVLTAVAGAVDEAAEVCFTVGGFEWNPFDALSIPEEDVGVLIREALTNTVPWKNGACDLSSEISSQTI